MRVKLSKLLSAVLAICIVFVGFTAFAAGSVTIVTTYDVESAANQSVTVTADVTGVAQNSEVTFLVANKTSGIASTDIVYINQETATDGTARFAFTDAWDEINAAFIKFGSDADFSQSAFKLNNTVNRWNSTEPLPTGAAARTVVTGTDYDDSLTTGTTYSFVGKATGPVNEYGIKITIDEVAHELPAMGSDADGNFVIVVNGITEAEAATAVVYGK